ncbi:MAG: formate dehydrogenase subunit alpha [Dehalococcoidales bacterium]|nr:formate dehydrogenase subunit alpha [Dehalococcoidales bacterium]
MKTQRNAVSVNLTIDGVKITVPAGTTVLEAARANGIYIPTLCYDPDLEPYGACRLCIVEIEGMRGLPTACTTEVGEGMVVRTETPALAGARRTTMELIMANHHGDCLTCGKNQNCELQKVARYLGVDESHYGRLRRSTRTVPRDESHPAYTRDMNKCILCGRCWRACHEIAGVEAIDVAFRGDASTVAPFGNKPVFESNCEACGECLDRCPTGALYPKNTTMPTREVKTICPYCGVGCSIYLGVRGNEIVSVRGDRESPVNRGGLCIKGRWGFDFVNHPDRLTRPLIRREGIGRDIALNGNFREIFREASWDEALDLVARRLAKIREETGPDSIGVVSSAKFTNEENYLVQKFARAVIGTNNIDHCARLCHASTVAAASACFGDGAMSNSIADFLKADLLFIIGSNTTECHPIIGRYVRQAVRSGRTKLIVADPRSIVLARKAVLHLRQRPGTDVALLNAMMHGLLKEGLEKQDFIRERTVGFEEVARTVAKYTPELAEEITGVPKDDIVRAARLFATAGRAAILYGMGITQHITGTDNVRCIANLLMMTGNIGCEGAGFSPLRGQNNVQGACDMGALPNVLPGYQPVADAKAREKFEKAWNCRIKDKPGLQVTEMINAAVRGELRAMYIVGENLILSEPHLLHTHEALKKLDFIVVQDIFPTETAALADVVLPAAAFAEKDGTYTNTERRVQRCRRAVEPPGEARPDWQIVSELATRMGYPFPYRSTRDINAEVASLTPIYGGITFDRLEHGYGLQWPCRDASDPGTPIPHVGRFTCGLGRFQAVEYRPPAESPSAEYPLTLTTGRILEHYHTGSMSRRTKVLREVKPTGGIDIHPEDAARLGVKEGDIITVGSVRGEIRAPVHITDRVAPGLAFMAFHWKEAPANMLTNSALDPTAKIPELKVAAIRVRTEKA